MPFENLINWGSIGESLLTNLNRYQSLLENPNMMIYLQ
jgi:hypothetical protein